MTGAVDVRCVVVVGVVVVVVVVVVLFCCFVLLSSSPHMGSGLTSSRALGNTVRLLRSNGDTSMALDDGVMR